MTTTAGRTLSSGTATEVAKPDSEIGWLVEIVFASFTARFCSYSDRTWNGMLFTSAGFSVGNLDSDAAQATLKFSDSDASIRTLCLTGSGARGATVRIWKAYIAALGASDPFMVFKGVGGKVDIANGSVTIQCARFGRNLMFAPRQRLGKATGCNFLAAEGTLVKFGTRTLKLIPRRG